MDFPFKVVSNGTVFALDSGSGIYIAENCFVKSVGCNIETYMHDVTRFGDPYPSTIPGLSRIDIDLALIASSLKVVNDIDIDRILFQNKTILDLLKVVQQKANERDEKRFRDDH